LEEHTALLAGLSKSSRVVDRVVTTMTESLTRVEERVAGIAQIEKDIESVKADLEMSKTGLEKLVKSIDQKPDLATVTAIGKTLQRVMEHLAELQTDRDIVRKTVASSEQNRALLKSHIAEHQDDHKTVKDAVTSAQERQRLMEEQEDRHRVRIEKFSQALEDLQRAVDSDREIIATIPEIRDRMAELAAHLAETARERTILAEEIDRLASAEDNS